MTGHMFGGFHAAGIILVLILAALLVYRLVKFPTKNNFDQRDSLEILKLRLASGEISIEDYNKMKSVLLECHR